MKSTRILRGVGVGLAAGAIAAAAAEAFRPRPGPARIVDWEEVRVHAHARVDDSQRLDAGDRRALEAEYERLAAEMAPRLLDFVGGLPEGGSLPPFQALDRHGWIDLNLGIVRDALDPVLALQAQLPNNRVIDFGRFTLDRYTAMLLGFLSRRVLGQYDPQLLGREPAAAPGLYLVEPNIADFEDENLLAAAPLRRWLILHELTHGWQFAAHPWLRDHLNQQITELIGQAVESRARAIDRLFELTFGARNQVRIVNRIQATMSLVEGYSNLVMNEVGRAEIPEFDDLEEAHQRRVGEKPIFERLFWRFTGLELKLQQYVVGERFCRAIYDEHGIEALNRAWESPANLPDLQELKDPDLWVARVLAAPRARRRTKSLQA